MMNLFGRKYHINPETLRYEELKPTAKKRLRNILLIGSGLLFLAFGMRVGYEQYAKSPRLVYYENKNDQLRTEYKMLDESIQLDELRLTELERKDDRLYRSIFGLEPLAPSIREAGTGGAPRNSTVQSISDPELIYDVSDKLYEVAMKARIQSISFEDIEELAIENQKLLAHKPSIQPISPEDSYWMTSLFGYRSDPFTKRRTAHRGVDMAGPYGLEIHTTGDGVVVSAHYNSHGYGKEVIIDHGFGYKSRYAHLKDIHVEPGEQVKRGHVIGTLGSTGRSTGPHLHYEVHFNRKAINPLYCFYENITAEEYQIIKGRAVQP
jgi:murein DD-endopeptidase MepM/ murein hydrolase activator NlpD